MNKRNTFLKRIGAMILVVAMIVTLAPTTAFARTPEESGAYGETVVDESAVYTDGTAAAEAGAAIGDAAGSETAAETEAPGEGSGIRNGVETVPDETAAPTDEAETPAETAEEMTEAETPGETAGDETAAPESTEAETPEETTEAQTPEETTEAETPEETTEAETPAETEAAMPAATLRARANGVNVTVNAPEGAFPEGTRMRVRTVDDQNVIDQIRGAVEGYVYSIHAVDIVFYNAAGEEIEPQAPIQVVLVSEALTEDGSVLVHLPDEENGVQAPAEVVEQAVITENRAEFTSEEFSVYAVVETGTDARVKVVFMNGTTTVATMYVKQADLDNLADVLYDPSDQVTIPDGAVFRGWTTVADYSASSQNLTIQQIRDSFTSGYNWGAVVDGDAANGTVVTYYAMLLRQYTITYRDQTSALGQSIIEFRADESMPHSETYTVNQAYTPPDDEHDFQGWHVTEGGSNISGHTDGKVYENNTQISVSGDVIFSVNAPEGHWLVFDENGKGATYNAPQFIHAGENTVAPTTTMTRNGYTFGGWYTDAECTDGSEFEFGH
ncbi:MAG: InlB B-repeat-containing protein, partial [Lachnospiraceae bacterium]|nr:InlB B-repeat-containing protein [Lachnospiraceae bacterium]